MIYIDQLSKGLPVFKALDSEIRLRILEELIQNRRMNMNEIAEALGMGNASVTMHMKILHEAKIVNITSESGKRGVQKVCTLSDDTILVKLLGDEYKQQHYDVEIDVGYYSNYEVHPKCGLANRERVLGVMDQPSYFAAPERIEAGILWFSRGFVEYVFPNYLTPEQTIKEVQFSLEISSEVTGQSDKWPSDIYFYFNNRELGHWTSPAEFGDEVAERLPDTLLRVSQAGMLKTVSINGLGTFLDGMPMSDLTINELLGASENEFRLKLAVPEKARHTGGLTIYGKDYGNFNQGLRAKVFYV